LVGAAGKCFALLCSKVTYILFSPGSKMACYIRTLFRPSVMEQVMKIVLNC